MHSPSPGRSPYWLLPLPLAGLQAWVSWKYCHEIRFEELAESVRSVYWLHCRLIYGIYTNIGWYAPLLPFYHLFGFSLYSAKIVRLIWHVIALYAAADILRRELGERVAWVPLVLFGLSPTVLYFGAMENGYGLDMPFAAICLWLLLASRRKGASLAGCAPAFACGFCAMMAALSYPVFLFYLPALIAAACFLREGEPRSAAAAARACWRPILSAGAGFAAPYAAALAWLHSPQLRFYDPATHSRVFQGAGKLGLDFSTFWHALTDLFGDFFIRGGTYHFDVSRPEFSGILAMIGLAWIFGTAVRLAFKSRRHRVIVGCALLLMATSLILPNLSVKGGPGIRRCTGVIPAYFVLFALAWSSHANPAHPRTWRRRVGMLLCLALPIGQCSKISSLLADASSESIYRDRGWFDIHEGSPTASLAEIINGLNRGLVLANMTDGRVHPGRYEEIYAAVSAWHLWNDHQNRPVLAVDWKTGRTIPLTPELWQTNYFQP